MKKTLIFGLLLCVVHFTYSQDEMMDMLGEGEEKELINTTATFKATRIVNGHTIEMRRKKSLDFLISHRFGKINSGAYELFGIDNSNIRFALEYGVLDFVNVGIGRSSFEKTYDGFAKIRLLRQSTGAKNVPVTITAFSSIAANTLKINDTSRTNYFTSRLYFTNQLLIARKMNDNLSVQLMPTMVHRNLVYAKSDPNDIFALGAGARYRLSPSFSLNGEYYYQFNRNLSTYYYNSMAIAAELETGGHVFQFSVSNSRSMIEKGFITETDGKVLNGDLNLGFNIFRTF